MTATGMSLESNIDRDLSGKLPLNADPSTSTPPSTSLNPMKKYLLLSAFAVMASVALTFAETTTTFWQEGDGEWTTGGNWDNGMPDGNFSARFNTAGAKTITIGSPVEVQSIHVGTDQTGDVAISGSQITFAHGGSNQLLAPNGKNLIISNNLLLNNRFNVNIGNDASATLDGIVTSSGTTAILRKIGGGSLNLNGDNSTMTAIEDITAGGNPYTGVGIIHEAGTISAGHDNALGTGAVLLGTSGNAAANLDATGRTINNDLIFQNQGGGGATRLRTARDSVATFTANSISGPSDFQLSNNGTGTGGAIATLRFTGNALTVENNVTIAGAVDRLDIANANGTQTWSGNISGNGGLIMSGSGVGVLSGENTYTGTTQVDSGTLLINGSHSGEGAITVAGGAVLGREVATALSLSGDVTFQEGSGVQFQLNDDVNASLNRTGGDWDIASNLEFTFTGLGTVGETYALFTGLDSDVVDGNSWTITNTDWDGDFSYDDGTVNFNLTAIPEPSTMALLGLSLGTLLMLRRRKC